MVGAWFLLWAVVAMAMAQTVTAPGVDKTDDRQEATVTFYSGGSIFHGVLPFTNNDVFQGCIFELKAQLACISWRRYAVVKLPPGMHVFSASLSDKHGAVNSQTPLLLEAGKTYYLRTTDKHVKISAVPVPIGMVPVVVPTTLHPVKGFLELVSCEVAAKDTADFAPAGARIADKDWARRPRNGAPTCPAAIKAP